MFYLSEQERIARLEGEVVMWFRQAQEEHQRAEQMAARVRELNAHIDGLEKAIDKMAEREQADADRFEAITTYINAAQKTGYQTSWNIGAMTYDAIKEQTIAANAHKAPPTVLLSEWEQVGGMVTQGDDLFDYGELIGGKGRKMPSGVLYRPVYAKIEKQNTVPKAKLNTDKTSKVKGVGKA